jgi:hypothetical protein
LEQDLSWTPEARFQQVPLVDKLFSSEDIRLTKAPELELKASDTDML